MTIAKNTNKIVSAFLALLLSASFLAATPFYASAAPAFAQVEAGVSTSSSFGSWFPWFTTKPIIRSIDPESGPTGTTITLTGRRFNDDSVVRLGRGVISDTEVSDDGRMLSFVLPEEIGRYCPPFRVCTQIAYEVEPGEYDLRVQNGLRKSNIVEFEVTEDTTEPPDEPLTIDSIEGPTALEAGAEGAWTVGVTSEDDDALQYSVKWGDEATVARLASLDEDMETQSSATFTHTYTEPGTYQPEFTVTDEDGNTVTKMGDSVVVTEDTASEIPQIVSITPDSASTGGSVTITGTGFDSDSTVSVGGTAAQSVDVQTDTTIVFTVPTIATGTHAVTVTDDDGTSNSVNLEVIVKKGTLSINGVSAPTRLDVGENGTWTLSVDSNLGGNLQYSVDWGETMTVRGLAATDTETQSSATFSHAYQTAGTYHPTFTVTDEQGNTTSASVSVIVTADVD